MKRTLFVVLAVLLLLGLAGAACSAPAPTTAPATTPPTTMPPSPQVQKTFTWKMQSLWASTGAGRPGVAWANWVKDATDGRLTVQFFEPAALVATPEVLTAVGKGVVECAFSGGMNYPTFTMGDVAGGLLMGPRSPAESWDLWHNRGLNDLLKKTYAEQNVYYLAPFFLDDPYNFAFRMPVKSLADIQGKKVRAGGLFADLVGGLGGAPVVLPYGEVYMALKLGTLDGAAVVIKAGLIDSKQSEVATYMFDGSLNCLTDDILINMDAWNALPADIQKILSRDSAYVLADQSLRSSWLIEESKTQLVASGITFVQYTPDEWATLTKTAQVGWDKLAARDPKYAAPAIEMIRKQQRDLGRLK